MMRRRRRICRPVLLSAFLMPASLLAQDMMQGVPYVTNPYGGMFGSMGNVYSPYYRQFHQYGMSGPLSGTTTMTGMHYIISPYGGMYGSMGNVYSPYYRQFHWSGMSGTGGPQIPGVIYGQGTRYHYPYFLPPTMGTR